MVIPTLLEKILISSGSRGTPTEVVPGHLWHLGNATWGGRKRDAYFARYLHDLSRPTVCARLSPYPKSVLFFPTVASAHRWGTTTPNPVVALESVLSYGPDGLTFDPAAIEARLADAGLVGSSIPKKKPVRKRATRATAIAALTEVVIAHLWTAREHAFVMQTLHGAPELYPSPTQKQLAKVAGLSEVEVSRCLNDPAARELNLYWKTALDLGWCTRPVS